MSQSDDNSGASEPTFDQVLDAARGKYESSVDGTLGIEEEFAVCDDESFDLVPQYEAVREAAESLGMVNEVAGELLASEIEFRTGRNESWRDAVTEMTNIRARACEAAEKCGLVLASSGTHPWADYREQTFIDTAYYRELVERMQYVAKRNNTFGLHVHVGVRGPDRAIAVHDVLRTFQPHMLALSASSPFVDGRDTGLASTRAMIFSRHFIRGNVAPIFGDHQGLLDHMRWLRDAGSIDSIGQVWWGTRPHLLHGTVEFRMFDGQPDVRDTLALAAVACGLIRHLCDLHDAGELPDPVATNLIDENCWRATRYGLQGELINVPDSTTISTRDALNEIIEWARAASDRHKLGLDEGLDRAAQMISAGSSANWQRELANQTNMVDAFRAVIEATMVSAREPHNA